MASLPKTRKISVASTNNHDEATSSSSPPPPPRWIHDVFLSFRGEDTRLNFTAHLHFALKQRGVKAYLDDNDLHRGTFIESTLWKAIEESRFSIIVFSKNYAASSWCLDELVKIVQCKEKKGHIPLPVFYDVDPYEVAEQTKNYGKAFVEHGCRENPERVQSWKDSLTTVAKLAGWDVRSRNESEIIRQIVEDISRKLSCTICRTSKGLVGIEARIKRFNSFLDEASNDTHFIGISGMGGLGKTTLAREVYERIHSEFEGACLLENVREVFVKDGAIPLQEQLLSETLMQEIRIRNDYKGMVEIQNRLRYKKVLVILDDVDKREQLEKLAAEHGWFGPGSRIIITSRDKHVLTAHGVTRIYEAEKLNDAEALILFCLKAFKQDQPIVNYQELSKCIVSYADGLPLALEVIGSFLYGRSTHQWESEINKLKESPKREIFDVLRISFDGLDELEKEIFLDIACFFKGMKEDRVTRILDSSGFNARIGIEVLIDKSLISVSRNELWMHDLLQIMGKKIVHQESPKNASERSRLWKYKDVFDALMNSMGRVEVESIFLDLPKQKEATWNMKAFSKCSKLRLIKINNVELCQGPEHLSNELRFLEWHAFPSKSLPVSFQPDVLVELDMSYSCIVQLWHGFKSLGNLKIINLSYSLNLTNSPDFTGTPNLERLILEGCESLFEVHPSFGSHKKLEYVNLVACKSLRSLPSILDMESLKHFTLNGCSRLGGFPENVRNMNCLGILRLNGTAIEELPSSIQYFSGLVELSLKNCQSLKGLPRHVSGLSSLEKLDLCGCFRLQRLPKDLGKLEWLKELDASGTAIRELPESIFLLKNLKVLSFDSCDGIDLVWPSLSCLDSLTVLNLTACNLREGVIPDNIGHLSTLKCLYLSRNKFLSLPASINQLSVLETLELEDCRMIQSLPLVPSHIQNVNFNGCISLKQIPDPIVLDGLERSEFKCLNCLELYNNNGGDVLGFAMLSRYLKGMTNPRPGFSIVVPGTKIPEWFVLRNEGSSISIEVPPRADGDHNGCNGIAACVAFSGCEFRSSLEDCGSRSLFCHFKTNGRKYYTSAMWIDWNFIEVLSDHIWLFYLSFDHHIEWQHECLNNFELSFHSGGQRLKVKNCGVALVSSSTFGFTSIKAVSTSLSASTSTSSDYISGSKALEQEGQQTMGDEISHHGVLVYPSRGLKLENAEDLLDALRNNKESEVVELVMHRSKIPRLWYGFKSLVNLKIIDLSYSQLLTNTPDFSETPNLEKLVMKGCVSLSEVHPSIRSHKKLEYVNLENCGRLTSLPSELEMKSLKVFSLQGCSSLKKFPDIIANMSCLYELRLDWTAIEELPSSIQLLSGLVLLSLTYCRRLKRLPSCFNGLQSLEKLYLSGCFRFQNLPQDLGKAECLKQLDARETGIRNLPASTFLLKNLEMLSLYGCNLREGVLLENIGQLTTLRFLDLGGNNFCSLPER